MPEYMELVILRLALLMLIVAGVSVITSINTNVRHKVLSADAVDRTQPGDVMEPNTNPSGTEQDPDGFLGETGALVMDVQHTGNSLAMLLKSPKDGPDEPQSYRVLTWTFRQGCALGWFPGGRAEDKCKPNTYPASYFQRFRSRMSYWFCFTNLLGGGKEVLAQIDCTTKMNAAEWNMNTVPPDFEFSPGWFDRISGNVSILEQPSVWMARVREDFERRVVLEPDLPAVLWMGDKATSPIWKGIGYKSKSEILNRFWKCTKIGVFVTLGELAEMGPEGVDRLTDLCLCTIMFLQSEVWAGK